MPENSTDSPIEIKWNSVSVREWRELIRKAEKSNLLQSWPYAQAILITDRLVGKFATVHWQNRIVGICQVLEQKMLGVFHKVQLHRGPLWLESDLPSSVEKAFWQEIRHKYPSRPWRFMYLLPEMQDTKINRGLLTQTGFKRIEADSYSSIWLDLEQSEEDLRANLKRNWRNHLNQSEKKNLALEIDTEGDHLSWLLKHSEMDKILKEFKGPSPEMVSRLRWFTKDRGDFLLLRATKNNEPIGAILIFLHEASATYLVGWNSQDGRRERAHNYLIWQAILELKKRDIKWLDLGGINPTDAKGVTVFKQGIGGENYSLVGSYR